MPQQSLAGYSKKNALLEEAVTLMNAGKYGQSSAALKDLLALDPHNTEARRLFATLHLRLGSLVTARQAFETLANEAIARQDFWLAESLLCEYLAAGPRCVPFLELLARVYEEKGDVMAAVAELGKAIDLLIEDPDSENPKKPSQLYAKVRELVPASSVAFRFASLFDVQTGELLGPHPAASTEATSIEAEDWACNVGASAYPAVLTAATSSEADVSQSLNETLAATEDSRTPGVISREQFGGALPSSDVPPPTSSNSAVELFNVPDVPIDQEAIDPASPEPRVSLSEAIGSMPKTDSLGQDILPAMSDLPSAEGEPAANPTLYELPLPASEHRDDGTGDPLVEFSSFVDEGLASPSAGERTPDARTATSSVISPGVSSPMPWEQVVEDITKSEDAVPLFGSDSVLAVSSNAQPESVSDQFARPSVLSELEVPAPPAAFSNPDAISPAARELGSVQPEFAPEPERAVSFRDPGAWPSAHPSILSEECESIAETDASRESDVPRPAAAFLSEDCSRLEESPTLSSGISSSFMADAVPSVSQPVEFTCASEPAVGPSFTELQSLAPLPEVSDSELSRSAVVPEARPAPNPVSTEHHEIPSAPFLAAAAPSLSVAPSEASSAAPASMDTPLQWSTGEVEVQAHRPSEKKRNWDKGKGGATVVPPASLPLAEESSEPVVELPRGGGWVSASSAAPAVDKGVLQEDTRPMWAQASDSITFVSASASSLQAAPNAGIEPIHSSPESVTPVAASAVDVLFDSTERRSQVRTQDRLVPSRTRPGIAARVRIGISSFLGSCFSTTQSMAMLCIGLALFCAALVAIGMGAVGLAWLVMEEPPTPGYHNLTTASPEAHIDSKKNGYFLLLGFEAPAERDPLQAGYERRMEEPDLQAARVCMAGDERKGSMTGEASANVARGWFASADPVAQMKGQTETLRSWATKESIALRRYQRWLSMPFEDVGYGELVSPNCGHILLVHRLYLAEGFTQDFSTGLDRLETDMGSWRVALGQSKTLMVKMLTATAIQDDVAIVSGLLLRQDLDGASVNRLGKIVRPLDQVELSLRWPMQSHFLWATKAVKSSLKNDKTNERPLYVTLAAAMPLPVQRRSNAYADYYETANKAVAEGRYTNLPKPSGFVRTPAVSMLDYLANPIEHIIGIEPLPSWDPYVGRIVETDARLRLASLQAWIRRGAQEGNVLTRLAKAGQAHYDPFTGLPMLVNQQKGVMYSVGQDGQDQDGDIDRDIVATIPIARPSVIESPRAASMRK